MMRAIYFLMAGLAALLLGGCGGGGLDVAGVGSGGSGLAGGTVSGFGSVYVDGVEIEDAQSSNVTENADGSLSNTSLKLGQRVQVLRSGAAVASRIDVQAAVVAPVDSVTAATSSTLGLLRVAGQTVTISLTGDTGAATAFGGGYQSLADVAPQDVIEVHGTPVAVAGGTTLRATRIDRIGTTTAVYTARVMGPVSRLDATGSSFMINGLTVRSAGAARAPDSAALADGATVIAWGSLSGTDASGSLALQASRLRVLPVLPAVGTSGTSTIVLKGAIGAFKNTMSFVVRNVAVDASGIDTAAACPGITLAGATYVEVTALAQTGTDVVKATALRCTQQPPPYASCEYRGTATAVAPSAQTFTLALGTGAAQAVRWTSQTVFKGVTASALQGQAVMVDGYLDAGVLVAREVRVPGLNESDRFDPRNGADEWSLYDNTFRPPKPPRNGGDGAPR